jgi:hypothetical protein
MDNFEFKECLEIKELHLKVEEYEHKILKTKHYHLIPKQNLTQENVFMVVLKTLPQDDTGVAHILEHTVLCGSKKYPIRDPFFTMLKRSIPTFMNAMTGSDFTCYPFASQNIHDFNNLLDVYLDAVFFSNIEKNNFLQEGWRLDFKDDSNTELEYKGVVYNEMKGVMSNPISEVWYDFCHHFYKDSTYHFNSGGDPSKIPGLTYEKLIEFYKIYYHPSNSVFFTYGNMKIDELHYKFEESVMKHFTYLKNEMKNFKEQKINELRPTVYTTYASSENDINHIVFGWSLTDIENVKENARLELMYNALMMDSSSPILGALENSGFGTVSSICGFDSGLSQSLMLCGLEGVKSEKVEEAINYIESIFNNIDYKEIDKIALSILKQMEMDNYEIKGNGYPYGLKLMMGMISLAINEKSPFPALDFSIFNELEQEIKESNGKYISNLVSKYILNNKSKLIYVTKSDPNLIKVREQREQKKLENIRVGMNLEDDAGLINQIKELISHQEKIEDFNILPKINVSDISKSVFSIDGEKIIKAYGSLYKYNIPTNGICYAGIIFNTANFSDIELKTLGIYNELILELGVGERNYIQETLYRNNNLALLDVDFTVGQQKQTGKIIQTMTFSGKTIKENSQLMLNSLLELLLSVRFDETDRIKYLLQEIWQNSISSVSDNGESYSSWKASSKFNEISKIKDFVYGASAFEFMNKICADLDKNIVNLIETLKSIHEKILNSSKDTFILGNEDYLTISEQFFDKNLNKGISLLEVDNTTIIINDKTAIIAETQVNNVILGFKCPSYDDEDAPKLRVLASFFENKYIHPMIREKGGAYGGRCGYESKVILFSSYRDPRLLETLADYNKAIELFMVEDHTEEELDQAILTIIQEIDKPFSPINGVVQDIWNDITDKDILFRENYKEAILSTTLNDLKLMAKKYIYQKPSVTVIFTNKENSSILKDNDFHINIL